MSDDVILVADSSPAAVARTVAAPLIPILSNGKHMQMKGFTQTSDWVRANVEVGEGGWRKCMLMVPAVQVSGVLSSDTTAMIQCPHTGWGPDTSTDTIATHMFKVHGVSSPCKGLKKSPQSIESGQQNIIDQLKRARDSASADFEASKFRSGSKLCFSSRDDCVALAFVMNPAHAIDIVDDPYWKLAFGATLL
jgi:hypothetical protein